MIEFHMVAPAADSFTASVRVIAIDRTGSGIQLVRLLDRFRVVLREESGNCAPELTFVVDSVEHSRFPLFVEGTACDSNVTPSDRAYPLTTGGTPDAGVSLPCSSLFCSYNSACSEAEAAVHRARSVIAERCGQVSAARSTRDAYAAAAAAMFALATALFGLMAGLSGIPIVGQGLALIAMVAAIVALGVAIGLSVRVWRGQMDLERAQSRLDEARRDFTSAVDAVSRACCPGCITADLNQPEC